MACNLASGRRYAYDPLGRVQPWRDQRYSSLITDILVVNRRATIPDLVVDTIASCDTLNIVAQNNIFMNSNYIQVDAQEIVINANLTAESLCLSNLYGCGANGSLNIVAGEAITIVTNNVDVFAENTYINSNVVIDGSLCVTDLYGCGPNGTLNIHGNITLNVNSATTFLSSVGGGTSLVDNGTGPFLTIKSLTGNSATVVTESGGLVTITSPNFVLVSTGTGHSMVSGDP